MMIWTILLIKKNDNGWFINYIENKLINQIIKNNLQGKISVLVFEPNIQFNSEFVSVIDEQIDISDNFIIDIYSVINTHTCECVGLKGIVKVNEETLTFNNISKKDNEVILPITKLNPIKLNLISKNFTNIIYYINSQFLPNIAYAITHVSQPIVFLERITKKTPISIIISAYQTQDYIEECLDSIENQTYFINNNDFEVLVGVDACEDTLNKLNQIKHKYRNLHIHMMGENKGTYITTNTLIDLVKYEDVIRFDSDDVMTPNLVNEVIKDKNDSDIVLLGSVDYQNGKIGSKLLITEGVIYFKKSIMDNIAGGYMPWRCSADTELIKRLVNKVKITQIKKALFYRRMHNQSLTQRPDTGYNSELRKEYKKQIKQFYNDDEIKIERVINNISFNKKSKKNISLLDYNLNYNKYDNKKIGILVVNYNNLNYTRNCINDLLNQINKNFELYVVDQNSNEYGTKEYLNEIKNLNINVINNTENVDLNKVWNNFYKNCHLDYLCFLNNDIRLTNNFTDDTLNVFRKEINVGMTIHVTNNLLYTSTDQELKYEILNPPLNQGWDYCIRRELYTLIPDTLRIFGGEDFLYSNMIKTHKVALIYSSPIIHYKEKTRNISGDIVKQIHNSDIINFHKEVIKNNLTIVPPTYSTIKCNKYAPPEMKLSQNKNCIFTAVIGEYDDLSTSSKHKQENWDYICYSDNHDLISNFWKIINIPNDGDSILYNHKLARYIKTNFFKYLSSYDFLIWKDSRIIINCDLNEYAKLLGDNDILFMKHPTSNNILEEFNNVLLLKLENEDIIEKIKIKYKENNYKYDNGLMATGIILFRNNNRVIKFFKEWWNEIDELSYRDQLSANYILSKNHELIYNSIDQNNIISDTGYFLRGVRKTKRFNR